MGMVVGWSHDRVHRLKIDRRVVESRQQPMRVVFLCLTDRIKYFIGPTELYPYDV